MKRKTEILIPDDAPTVLDTLRLLRLPYETLDQVDPGGGHPLAYCCKLKNGGELVLTAKSEGTTMATLCLDTERPGASSENTLVLRLLERGWPGIVGGEQQAGTGENGRGTARPYSKAERAKAFKRIKDANPDLSYQGIATKANIDANFTEEFGDAQAHDVRNDYKRMGWSWERGNKIR
jgi:hypothetical protein